MSGVYRPYLLEDLRRAAARREFIGAGCFCGGGGSSAGIALAGGHVALATDHDREALRTYHANFPDTVVVRDDFRRIAASPATVRAFLAEAKQRPGEIDLQEASPPLQ